MPLNLEKYNEILFSFLYRDAVFPAVLRIKGFTLRGFIKTIFDSLIGEVSDLFNQNQDAIVGKIWLYAESVNQLRAIDFLEKVPEAVIVTNSNNLAKLFSDKTIYKLHYKTKLKHRAKRFIHIGKYKQLFKKNFKEHLNTIFKYDGIYESTVDLLQSTKPKAIIMANDHNAMCRALLIAGLDCGIKTIYLQHATVTDKFPPLKFDLSLLEGQDSHNKYKKAGPIEGKVELVGMPKFDKYFEKINSGLDINKIGIALNAGDNFTKYYELTKTIKLKFPDIDFIYRFHPSTDLTKISIPEYAQLSMASEESSFDFLTKTDILFAGNSSIHLEAVLMNVISAVVNFDKGFSSDYYGYIKNGLTNEVSSKEVINFLNNVSDNRPNVRSKAKYYVNTVNTKWDGKSTMKVIELVATLNG